MFTGIIQTIGRLEERRPSGSGARLTIATPRRLRELLVGESVSVNGACLTVTRLAGKRFTVDVSPETLRRTTLGRLAAGTRVNLERALRLGDRMGGHLVQGHVDGVGKLAAIRAEGDWRAYRFRAPAQLAPYLVKKGSIAVDGVSLTVAACRDARFTVALIPHSLAETTLGERRPGDRVNLEADVLLKQVAALLRASPPTGRETRLRGTGEGGARVPRR
ncbi:MAG: riboflavin synthase [Deltaproteobacteria bacterium]|nr:MAG: riboflavin synthase [Deltaproteobacteria bacterium]TMA53010.1 MAG: riboflavin synthase [Deltaproteobacteria bacterium]TMA73129.1 MAG: riboflavin synthase [Deltaproteobacteria bacterium]TMB22406.1 MAG: riboflavin synthase [Deltaproteobacteria bacterium]